MSFIKSIAERTTTVQSVKKELVNALFPLACTMCGRFFHANDIGADTGGLNADLEDSFKKCLQLHLCGQCSRRFIAAESPVCSCCGLIFRSREGPDHLCGECLETRKPFGIARAAGVYDQALMSVIHAYKYSGKMQMADPLSALLLAVYKKYWRDRAIDLVIPVPLHPARHRSRGFNQAYLLARPWGKAVNRDVLRRHRSTPPQTGLGKKMRQSNIRGAFAVTDSTVVCGKRILMVDDVYTTGATVGECARTLVKNGAAQVDVLTVARAVAYK